MRIDVVTLMPEFFTSALRTGLIGRALAAGIAEVGFVDPRDFARDRHRTVDDSPYGGGGGMLLKVEPLAAALAEARSRGGGPVLLLTPQGAPLTQANLLRWSAWPHVVLVAGRYEGFDERLRGLADLEVSLGDFVLTGGEVAALALIDGLVRLRPGTLGNDSSPDYDSFSDGLLEHPHYTRPPDFEGQKVPEVLLGGHHAKVKTWRRAEALRRTRARRPDLLLDVDLSYADRRAIQAGHSSLPVDLAIDLEPIGLETQFRQLTCLAASYGLRRVYVRPLRGVLGDGRVAGGAASLEDVEAVGHVSRARACLEGLSPVILEALSQEGLPSRRSGRIRQRPTRRVELLAADVIELVDDWSLAPVGMAAHRVWVHPWPALDGALPALGPKALWAYLNGSREDTLFEQPPMTLCAYGQPWQVGEGSDDVGEGPREVGKGSGQADEAEGSGEACEGSGDACEGSGVVGESSGVVGESSGEVGERPSAGGERPGGVGEGSGAGGEGFATGARQLPSREGSGAGGEGSGGVGKGSSETGEVPRDRRSQPTAAVVAGVCFCVIQEPGGLAGLMGRMPSIRGVAPVPSQDAVSLAAAALDRFLGES